MTTVANMKRVQEECANLCEESTQIWTELVDDPEMKAVEAHLREAQERAHQALEKMTTLPPT